MRGNYNAIFKPGKVIGVHRYIAILPLSHVFGVISGTCGCFYTGNLLFTCEDMKATSWSCSFTTKATISLFRTGTYCFT